MLNLALCLRVLINASVCKTRSAVISSASRILTVITGRNQTQQLETELTMGGSYTPTKSQVIS